MMRIVELVPENEFTDIGKLKDFYADRIIGCLATMGYAARCVDQSEYYSYERKIIVDTNAPDPVVDEVVREHDGQGKEAVCVLVG